jgi:hypothetical protein
MVIEFAAIAFGAVTRTKYSNIRLSVEVISVLGDSALSADLRNSPERAVQGEFVRSALRTRAGGNIERLLGEQGIRSAVRTLQI